MFTSKITYANSVCIDETIETYLSQNLDISNPRIIKKARHTLVYSDDSCGTDGCEYFIFSEIIPGCEVMSFNERGFLIPNSFKGEKLKIRFKNVTNSFKYSLSQRKFRWTNK
ncbi:MAG: hypothetical protein QF441_07855 [Bacteriovoracaceae bacterium]|nr:hypothetical protein [Bacteriovoracaceae bacterium]